MKRLLPASIVLILLLLLPVTAAHAKSRFIAQDGTQSALEKRIQERMQKQEEIRQEIMERIKIKKATRAAQLAEVRKEKIRDFFGLMSRRIEALINRLEKITERIEFRVNKIKEENQGVDTAKIESDVQEAKDLISTAKVNLEALNSNLEIALGSDNPKEAFTVIREGLKEIKDNLVEAHRILVHVIGDIKGLRVGVGKLTPTTTPTPVPTGAI